MAPATIHVLYLQRILRTLNNLQESYFTEALVDPKLGNISQPNLA